MKYYDSWEGKVCESPDWAWDPNHPKFRVMEYRVESNLSQEM
jgi:hypothetical protein